MRVRFPVGQGILLKAESTSSVRTAPYLISDDQTGFVSQRYIGDNLRLLYDMIYYLQKQNPPGLLVPIDFENAFDSVNWAYTHKALKAYCFVGGYHPSTQTFIQQ